MFAAMVAPLPRLFAQFTYATGMRAREALAVTGDDLDPADGTVLVRQAKGGRQRRTILPATLVDTLAAADRAPPHWRGPIFVYPNGRPLRLPAAQGAMLAARKRLGMTNGPTLHGLRHAFATHLHERGVGVGELRLLLGHQSLAITMRYLGMHGERRQDIARVGDLLGALRTLAPQQERLAATAR
jgi:integrase